MRSGSDSKNFHKKALTESTKIPFSFRKFSESFPPTIVNVFSKIKAEKTLFFLKKTKFISDRPSTIFFWNPKKKFIKILIRIFETSHSFELFF